MTGSWPGFRSRCGLLIAFFVGLSIPFLPQAFRIDDANILAIAHQVARNPSSPYDFFINWLGISEYAFDILANPPLVPAWLALWGSWFGWNEVVLHAAMLPFAIVLLMATASLAEAIEADVTIVLLLMLGSPAFVLGSQVVMPDVAMLSMFVATLALARRYLVNGRALDLAAASVCGFLTPLMKYNGVLLLPLLLCLAWFEKRRIRGLCLLFVSTLSGFLLWNLYSFFEYGRAHFLVISEFEKSYKGNSWFLSALIGALGLGILPIALLPAAVQRLRRDWRPAPLLAAAVGIVSFLLAMNVYGYSLGPALLFSLAGVMSLLFVWLVVRETRPVFSSRHSVRMLLIVWIALVLLMQPRLIFVSVRYLLPLLPPAVLLLAPAISSLPSRVRSLILLAGIMLAFSVAVGDAELANMRRSVIRQVAVPILNRLHGQLFFSGHWGLQYYAEEVGGRNVDGLRRQLGPGDLLVVDLASFPHNGRVFPRVGNMRIGYRALDIPMRWPIRTLGCDETANFYGHGLGHCREGTVFLPFGISAGEPDNFELFFPADRRAEIERVIGARRTVVDF